MSSGVDLREIRIFLIVAEELHLGRAAERLAITPSRVSQTIRTLQARVGGVLFERTSRRVRLTPFGEHLRAELTPPPYEQLNRALTNARQVATGVAGRLRLGMYTPANGGPRLLEILRTFQRAAQRLPCGSHRHGVLARSARLAARGRGRPARDASAAGRRRAGAVVPPRTSSGARLRRVPIHSTTEILMGVAAGELVHPTVSSFLHHHPSPDVRAVPIVDLPPSETALVWLAARQSPIIKAFANVAAEVVGSARSLTPPDRPRRSTARR
jgi:DNA-binding transcriptional LysR family regulator